MCVKFLKDEKIIKYNENIPLKEQLNGCTKVIFENSYDCSVHAFFENFVKEANRFNDIEIKKAMTALSDHFEKTEKKIDELLQICSSK